jgi:cellulose synthase/poly-beta-1,6-N-acetylglucosamine synthase-like glycosyltransferase
MERNTKYYSGKAPRRLHRDTFGPLPHLTVQMPVYKEGLRAVIEPTIRSIKQAMSTYELQGGTANIFINDDGMQLLSAEEAKARQDYYDEQQIGWVARPKHNPNPAEGEKPFLRRGKFKKASNMNYAMRLSVQVEEALAAQPRHPGWNQHDENNAYRACLQQLLAEREGEAWADGNIRMGDYILIIDSDTRVPNDCFLEAVSEMEQSPQVAILQYASGVMNVTNSFFENGITFFTNLIYTMIRFAVANGDVAPFVGHNAILRWSALQNIGYECEDDGWEKWWSESTVSEDFDMALRLQSDGYIVRLGAYKNGGYEEGVSLTVYDELARWEKYAYGCNELIFHPFKDWIFKGPFTKLFRNFICSNMPIHSKITIMAYIGTYYALGSAWILTLMNYVIIGLYNGHLDHYYLDSFKIFFSIIIVFSALGNFALAVLRYRIGESGLLRAIFTNLKWIPLLSIFLGGVSLHVSQALLCHFFSIDMQWGATSKEVEDISFFEAIGDVIKKFKYTFAFCFAMTAAMICMAYVVPEDWQIRLITAIFPMSMVVGNHFLLPIVLNPQLMTFTW